MSHHIVKSVTLHSCTANLCACGDICVQEHGPAGKFTIYTDGVLYGEHTKPMDEVPGIVFVEMYRERERLMPV